MKLQSATIAGYGRLADCKVNLSEKVMAIVGPNEAGKTSLLRALEFLDSGSPLPEEKRSRKNRPTDDRHIVEMVFQLQQSDIDSISDLQIEEIPTTVTAARTAGGKLYVTPSPSVQKSRAALDVAAASFLTCIENDGLALPDYGDDEFSETRLDQLLAGAKTGLGRSPIEVDDEQIESFQELARVLAEFPENEPAVAALNQIVDWIELDSPAKEVNNRLWRRIPSFLMFDDADRTLESSYSLTPQLVEQPPRALSNLLALAELDLEELFKALGDTSLAETLIKRANNRLQKRFAESWHQSEVAAHLKVEGTALRVFVEENADTITTFDERSAGLRSYIALFAFVAAHERAVPPVLLVDEAETHLHYDAQANLVDTFFAQKIAAQVIYTTHSPGCLPPDLGTGIRIVAPSKTDPECSEVKNSFWGGRVPGFSPLLLAMGASAAAFSVTRYAVIAEGPSEMILLPLLLRIALNEDHLPYQIAPGLSEAGMALYPELDGEAARTAFIVDGDPGGKTLRGQLMAAGVPAKKIRTLGAMTLEDVLDAESYVKAVNAEIHAANRSKKKSITIEEMPNELRPRYVEEWCRTNSVKCPSKVAVAVRLVQDGWANPSADGAAALRALDKGIRSALGIK